MTEHMRWQIETLTLSLPLPDEVLERLAQRRLDPEIGAILSAYRDLLRDRATLLQIALDNADRAAQLRTSNGNLIAQEARLQARIAELEGPSQPEPEPGQIQQLELL